MFRLLSLLIALGLLAGAARAQEREWSLDASDEDAYLIFGVADSDDVGLSLWCPIGKGVINLFLPVPTSQMPDSKDGAAPLTITANGETATFRGKADINREAAVSSLETEIATDHPLVAALKKADRVTVKTAKTEVIFPLYDADIEGLLALCRKN